AFGFFNYDLSYDPAVLSAVSVSFGSHLDLGVAGSIRFSDLTTPGTIAIQEESLESPAALNAAQPSSFTLATLTFKGVGDGLGTVSITGGSLSEETGLISLPFTSSAGHIQVHAPVPVCPQAQVVCNDPGACTAVVDLVQPTEPPNLVSLICTR